MPGSSVQGLPLQPQYLFPFFGSGVTLAISCPLNIQHFLVSMKAHMFFMCPGKLCPSLCCLPLLL